MTGDYVQSSNLVAIVATSDLISIRKPAQFNFDPCRDMTAYELASLMPYILGQSFYQEDYDHLESSVRRHLKVRV